MVEVIDFFWKRELDKTLVISGLQGDSEELLTGQLYELFSKHALIYDVVVFKSSYPANQNEETIKEENHSDFYALLKLYSKEAAKQILQEENYFNGNLLKIKYSYKQEVSLPKILYYKKCFELANHYLGFNGWSLEILKLQEIPREQEDAEILQLNFLCQVRLKFLYMNKECFGLGRASETYAPEAPSSKGVAFIKCKKQAYTNAVENAFSKVFLVVLENGKVHLEINNESTEAWEENRNDDDDVCIKVNIIDAYPNSDDDDDDNDDVNADRNFEDILLAIAQDQEGSQDVKF